MLAALFWTISSMLWGRVHLSPLGINLAKNAVGSTLLLLHLTVLAVLFGTPLLEVPRTGLGWLAISGLVGIVIGDTFFFRSIQILGPRLALMTATATPMFSLIVGYLLLGESLTETAGVGVILTVLGITVVVSDRKARSEAPGLFPGKVWTGVLCGLCGALCQSLGGALSKWGMEDCGPLEATFVRTCVALICTLSFATWQGKFRTIAGRMIEPSTLKFIIPAAGMGTWLGVWLSLVAFKYTYLATATTLMATCPIFALPVVHFYFGQRATYVAVAGSVIAIAGVYFVAREDTRPADVSPAAVSREAEPPANR